MEPYGPYSDYNPFDSAVEALAGLLDTLGSAVDKYTSMANYSLDPETCLDAAKLCDYIADGIIAATSGFNDISESVHVRNLKKQSDYAGRALPATRGL